jgi:histone-arginine methyltransferase CARM1
MFFMPFIDENLYKETLSKVSLWESDNFYGINMTVLKDDALKEKFRQPIIDIYDPNIQ